LGLDVSFEFLFSILVGVFLKLFNFFNFFFINSYCTFSMLEFFLESSKFTPLNYYVVF
jgi:hypothetical protein